MNTKLFSHSPIKFVLRVWILAMACILFSGEVRAQHFGHDMRDYFDFGEQFYAAAIQSADAASVEIRVNTAYGLFSFLKTDKAHASLGQYYAVRDLSIELREHPAGSVLKALNTRDTIYAATFAETTSKDAWRSYVRSMPLTDIQLPQSVELHFEVRDGFLARLANRPNSFDLTLRPYHHAKSVTGADSNVLGCSDVYVFDRAGDGNILRMKNWGATTEFSHDLMTGISFAMPVGVKLDSLNIGLTQTSNLLEEKNFLSVSRGNITIHGDQIIPSQLFVTSLVDSEILYKLSEPMTSDSLSHYASVLCTIPGKKLEQGKYRIDVKVFSGNIVRSFTQPIELQWHSMPLSLDNPRDAVPPLAHITTEEEYKNLSSGSRDEQLRKLYSFWKDRDPTPETSYNERMAEFYQRADYAYFNFARGPRVLDGATTDRGKIYILFGAPTNIERTFLVGEQPVEIWTYSNNVKKVVKFSDPGGHGDYKLTEVKPL
ncbi:MAG: GWxTD domain-containing protein [bacterium]